MDSTLHSPAIAPKLERLTKQIYLCPATEHNDTATRLNSQPYAGPKAVLYFGFMDAPLSIISKFVALHRELFPQSDIFIFLSISKDFFSFQSTRIKALKPVLPLLPADRLLIHVQSNGGSLTFTDFLTLHPLAPTAVPIIFDSTPGISEFWPAINAFRAPLKSSLVRLLALIVLTPIYVFLSVVGVDPIVRVRSTLNDLSVVGKGDRTYVYSKEDIMVQLQAVEGHASDAESKGVKVRLERFKGPHVGHFKGDPERYRRIVEELWRDRTR